MEFFRKTGPIVWVPLWVFLDQVTKALVRAVLDYRESRVVIPDFLSWTHAQNPGAAFGMFGRLPDFWRLVILIGISALVTVGLIVYYFRLPRHEKVMRWGLSLLVAGAIGNLIDRTLFGMVTDFIDVYATSGPLYHLLMLLGSNHWPTFNVADICVTCGAVLFGWYAFVIEPRQRRAEQTA